MRIYHYLRKRGLALFMALIMCLSLLPVQAMAAELTDGSDSDQTENDWTWLTADNVRTMLKNQNLTSGFKANDLIGKELNGKKVTELGTSDSPDAQPKTELRGDTMLYISGDSFTAEDPAAEPDPTPETTYTVTYTDGVEENVFADQTHEGLEPDAKTPAFDGTLVREGYTFTGWYPDVAANVTGDVTYTAQWEEEKVDPATYTVTYTDGVEDEVVFTDQVISDLELDAETPAFDGTLVREGYTFAGWAPEVAETVTGDVTYTAQWTEETKDNVPEGSDLDAAVPGPTGSAPAANGTLDGEDQDDIETFDLSVTSNSAAPSPVCLWAKLETTAEEEPEDREEPADGGIVIRKLQYNDGQNAPLPSNEQIELSSTGTYTMDLEITFPEGMTERTFTLNMPAGLLMQTYTISGCTGTPGHVYPSDMGTYKPNSGTYTWSVLDEAPSVVLKATLKVDNQIWDRTNKPLELLRVEAKGTIDGMPAEKSAATEVTVTPVEVYRYRVSNISTITARKGEEFHFNGYYTPNFPKFYQKATVIAYKPYIEKDTGERVYAEFVGLRGGVGSRGNPNREDAEDRITFTWNGPISEGDVGLSWSYDWWKWPEDLTAYEGSLVYHKTPTVTYVCYNGTVWSTDPNWPDVDNVIGGENVLDSGYEGSPFQATLVGMPKVRFSYLNDLNCTLRNLYDEQQNLTYTGTLRFNFGNAAGVNSGPVKLTFTYADESCGIGMLCQPIPYAGKKGDTMYLTVTGTKGTVKDYTWSCLADSGSYNLTPEAAGLPAGEYLKKVEAVMPGYTGNQTGFSSPTLVMLNGETNHVENFIQGTCAYVAANEDGTPKFSEEGPCARYAVLDEALNTAADNAGHDRTIKGTVNACVEDSDKIDNILMVGNGTCGISPASLEAGKSVTWKVDIIPQATNSLINCEHNKGKGYARYGKDPILYLRLPKGVTLTKAEAEYRKDCTVTFGEPRVEMKDGKATGFTVYTITTSGDSWVGGGDYGARSLILKLTTTADTSVTPGLLNAAGSLFVDNSGQDPNAVYSSGFEFKSDPYDLNNNGNTEDYMLATGNCYVTLDPTLAGLQVVNGVVKGTTPDPTVNDGNLVDKTDGGNEFDVTFSVLDTVGLAGSNPSKAANFYYYIPIPQKDGTISNYVDEADFTLKLQSVNWENSGVGITYTSEAGDPDQAASWTELTESGAVPEGIRWLKVTIKDSKTFAGLTATPITLHFQADEGYEPGDRVVFNARGIPALKDNLTPAMCSTSSVTIGVASAEYKVTYRYHNFDGTNAPADDVYSGTAIVGEEIPYQPADGFVVKEEKTYTLLETAETKYVSKEAGENELEFHFYFGQQHQTLDVYAPDYEVTYDGIEHSVTGFTGQKGQYIEVEKDGKIYKVYGLSAHAAATDAGKTKITVTGSASVVDPAGNPVLSITVIPHAGTLTINPRTVRLQSATRTKTYDGEALDNGDEAVKELSKGIPGEGFVGEDGVATYNFTGLQTDVGSSKNTFEYTLKSGTKAGNYDIKLEYGDLTVISPGKLKYTVNYLEKGTNEVLHEQKVAEDQNFGTFINCLAEKIDIPGYTFDHADQNELTIGIGENVINLYYTKRTDLSYTVKYLEKKTEKELAPAKVVTGKTFGDTVEESAIDIEGYDPVDTSSGMTTIAASGNEITFYYKAKTGLSYTVYYREQGTETLLKPKKEVSGKTFGEEVTEEAIEIDGYSKVTPTEKKIKIAVSGNEITFYYAKRNDLSYTVKYLEKTNNRVLHEAKVVPNQAFGTVIDYRDEIITTIDGYAFDSTSVEKLKIGTGENVINLYYAKVDGLSYTVNYLEQDTNKVLAPAKVEGNQTFEATVTEAAIDIEGYNKVIPVEKTITIGTGKNEITFYYTKRNDLSYTVKYLERDTNKELHEVKTVGNQTFGAEVTENTIEIEGYNAVEPTEKTITIGVSGNEITFYYTKRTDLGYTVKYLEKDTNAVLHTEKTVGGQTFEASVTEHAIDIEGYDKVEPAEKSTTIGISNNEIIFYYTKRTDLRYTVKYLEKDTNAVLHTEKTVDGQTFEASVTENAIDIEGYNKAEPASQMFTIGVGSNEITFYYTKRDDLSYTVNYLEISTNTVLREAETVNDQVFGTVIDRLKHVKEIQDYKFDHADPEELAIGAGENVLNIYYTKVSGLSYTVKYLEQDTSKVLSWKDVDGKSAGERVTENAIEIAGYNKVDPTNQEITIGISGNEILFYYTKRNDLSYTVNYLEKDTGKVLHEAKTVTGQTFEASVTENAVNIEGYNKADPASQTITIGVSGNEITFYYTKRTDLSYTVNYLEKGTNKVLKLTDVVYGQTFGAEIKAEEQKTEIAGYQYDSSDAENGTLTIGTDPAKNVINLYYTKLDTLSYTVNYLEKDTNAVLQTAKKVDSKTLGDIIVSSDESVEIDGYKFDSADKKVLVIGSDENVLNLYYTKRNDLSYTVKYLEKDTNTELHATRTETGKTFEEEVTETAIEIEGYNTVEPTEKTITIGVSDNEITFYYTKRSDLSYTVNYLERGTGRVLADAKTVDGQTFGAEVTERAIDIEGYDKAAPAEVTITIKAEGNEINFTYTLQQHTVTFDSNGGSEVSPQTVNHNETAAEPAAPTRRSYTFVRWNLDGEAYDFSSAVTRDITLTAQWRGTGTGGGGTGGGGGGTTPMPTPTPTPTPIPNNPTPLDPGTALPDQNVPLAGAVGLNNTDHFAYIAGYENNTVRPTANITRAEVAAIFFRLMTEEFRVANWSTENTFSDVKASDWYNNAISTCVKAGIIKGYEDGTFRPGQSITRAEFAAIAARFLGPDADDEGVGDFSDTAGKWYSADVRKAAKAGWILGNGNRFEPDANISRAQVMAIVNRMLDRTPDADHMLPTMKTWIDNPEGTWYYVDVQEATNGHDYTRDETNVETWTVIQSKKNWVEIEAEWAANNGASAPKNDAQPAETDGETK